MSRHGNLQKYESSNLMQQWLLKRFLQQAAILTASLKPRTILDAGCAEGFVSRPCDNNGGGRLNFGGLI
jgi:hypothetical protein